MKLPDLQKKTSLDKDLKQIVRLEQATQQAGQKIFKIGMGVLFLVVVWIFATLGYYDISVFALSENSAYVVSAGIIGGYMALNIGANDVANNVGPAVGSKALTMFGALIIAAVFEASGAMLAGGDVVSTIKKGIIDPTAIPNTTVFIQIMLAALLAASLWLNLATYVGAPVSTTHSIVGGVMGAGIAAIGLDAVNWVTMAKIAASWVISPIMGGIIAAAFLAFIKFAIYSKDDMIAAAVRWVPVLVAIMASVFSIYLAMKGLKKIWKPDPVVIAVIGAAIFVATYGLVKPAVLRASENLESRRKAVSSLFTIPLIISAAMLSFAHGANDVANAVGPLAGIVSAATTGSISVKAGIPIWVMMVGAIGISAGLVLFGPKLIRTVGEQITKLDQARAFCVALSASITVIIASTMGLPVSSTHIAVGGVFGVGFLREYLFMRRRKIADIEKETSRKAAEEKTTGTVDWEKRKKKLAKSRGRKLVRRSHLMTIIAAWLITVPLAALMASIIYYLIRAISTA